MPNLESSSSFFSLSLPSVSVGQFQITTKRLSRRLQTELKRMCSKSKPWSPGTDKYCVLLLLLILTEAKISDIITCMSQPANWPSRSSSESFLFCGGDLTLRRQYLIASFFLQGTEGCLALGCHHIQGEPQVQRMVPQLFTSPNGPGTGWLITPRFIQWETAAPRGDTSWRPQWGLGLWDSNSGQLGSLITSLLFPSLPTRPSWCHQSPICPNPPMTWQTRKMGKRYTARHCRITECLALQNRRRMC